jgi:hypothetical protein
MSLELFPLRAAVRPAECDVVPCFINQSCKGDPMVRYNELQRWTIRIVLTTGVVTALATLTLLT